MWIKKKTGRRNPMSAKIRVAQRCGRGQSAEDHPNDEFGGKGTKASFGWERRENWRGEVGVWTGFKRARKSTKKRQ